MKIAMNKYEKKRDKSVDVLKASCLVFMVLGHCGFPWTQFIYLFHMPLFFMASGYLFNKNRITTSKAIKNFFFRKVKSLWVPYVVWNIVFLVAQNLFLKMNFYTDNPEILVYSGSSTQNYINLKEFTINVVKIMLFKSGTLFTSAFWFIRTLFVVEIIFALLIYLLNDLPIKENVKNAIIGGIAVTFLMIGYLLSVKHIKLMDFSTCFVGVTLFWLGTVMKKQRFILLTERKGFVMAAFVGLVFLNMHGVILINKNEFTNPLFLLCSSICGWILIFGISQKLSLIDHISDVAYRINAAAIDIMALHFIAFKVVASIQIAIWKLPIYQLARFPVLDGNRGWWVLYAAVGLFLPLLFYKVRNYILGEAKKWIHSRRNLIRKMRL